ncbi:hypothetical protein HAX54_039311, partial [Datura stramonium]|nr:hypothetical protein [Datura stramonium]
TWNSPIPRCLSRSISSVARTHRAPSLEWGVLTGLGLGQYCVAYHGSLLDVEQQGHDMLVGAEPGWRGRRYRASTLPGIGLARTP